MTLCSYLPTLILICSITWSHATNLENGYARLRYGYRLRNRMISSFLDYSLLSCTEECIRTTRCQSFNYHQGTRLCQTNYENEHSARAMYEKTFGWTYSDIKDWSRDLAGSCSLSRCAINEKCVHQPFGQFKCILSDCGLPSSALTVDNRREWDGIGIAMAIHFKCTDEYQQRGSERFVCQANGKWASDLSCEGKRLGCFEDKADRILELGPIRLSQNGRNHCKSFCSTKGEFRFYGLEMKYKNKSWVNTDNWTRQRWDQVSRFGSECLCGSEMRYKIIRDDSECNMPCEGNVEEFCGAAWRIELFTM